MNIKRFASITTCIVSTCYTFWYMQFGVVSIKDNSGALSTIGLKHPVYFFMWGILTLVALLTNFIIMYKTFKPKYNYNKFFLPIITIGMLLTLFCKFDFDFKAQYFAHCIGSLSFSALSGVNLLLFFISFYKKNKVFKCFTFLIITVLITSLVLLIIFKESSVLEVVPMLFTYVVMCLVNSTNIFSIKEALCEPVFEKTKLTK